MTNHSKDGIFGTSNLSIIKGCMFYWGKTGYPLMGVASHWRRSSNTHTVLSSSKIKKIECSKVSNHLRTLETNFSVRYRKTSELSVMLVFIPCCIFKTWRWSYLSLPSAILPFATLVITMELSLGMAGVSVPPAIAMPRSSSIFIWNHI